VRSPGNAWSARRTRGGRTGGTREIRRCRVYRRAPQARAQARDLAPLLGRRRHPRGRDHGLRPGRPGPRRDLALEASGGMSGGRRRVRPPGFQAVVFRRAWLPRGRSAAPAGTAKHESAPRAVPSPIALDCGAAPGAALWALEWRIRSVFDPRSLSAPSRCGRRGSLPARGREGRACRGCGRHGS
jgi:hypothetical protein